MKTVRGEHLGDHIEDIIDFAMAGQDSSCHCYHCRGTRIVIERYREYVKGNQVQQSSTNKEVT